VVEQLGGHLVSSQGPPTPSSKSKGYIVKSTIGFYKEFICLSTGFFLTIIFKDISPKHQALFSFRGNSNV